MLRSDARHWGSLAKLLHWGIALLILAQAVIGLVMVNLPRRPSVIAVYDLHKSIGLSLLLLVLLRLAWRIFDPHPDRPTGVTPTNYRFARLVHACLYALLLAAPLSGWIFDSASGLRPLHWWGWLTLPSLTSGPRPDWVAFTRSLHHLLVWALVAMATGHALAALLHHYFKADETLRRMLPQAGRGSRSRT